ncbi:MAG: hypothetical protein CMJ58_05355 [Planctomycetaceae bacterium]|nr:hypothetical protein [Planctomycetaceae bacterium]
MTPTEQVLAALRDRDCDPRRSGKSWSARCPAHEDRRPSLTVSEGDDGRALLQCHAGCPAESVCRALGLTLADLMPATKTDARPPANGTRRRRGDTAPRRDAGFPTAQAAIDALQRKYGPASARWTYHDARGEPVGVVARWDRPDGKKDIRPVSRQGERWTVGGMSPPRPLYALTDLAGAPRVYVTEGEKAADATRSLGLTATTSAHGANSPGKTDWAPLAGRECIILPDHDAPGEKYAQTVAGILAKLSPPAAAKLLRLPGLPEHGDIADWVAKRPNIDAAELRRQVEELADRAEPLAAAGGDGADSGAYRPVLTRMADIEPRPITWLWSQRIAAGRITLAVGMPGAGKSFLTCDLAARVSTGTPFPDGSPCQRGSVVFITAEDDPHDTIRPRLDAHRADVSRIHLLSGVVRVENNKAQELMFTLADADILRQALQAIPDCRLVVIDPIGSFLGGRCDAHRDNEVRGVLAPIAKLAEQFGPAVLMVAHRRKSAGAIADDTALGSRAFTGIARSVWHLSRDPEARDRRLLLPGKCNLSAEQTGLAFAIAGEPASVHWERDPVAMTADDALARENGAGSEHSAIDEAAEWLRTALDDGPRPSGELKSTARRDGIAWRTVERAKAKLNVTNRPDGFGGPWVWALPDAAIPPSVRQAPTDSASKNTLADSGGTVADCAEAGPADDWGEL